MNTTRETFSMRDELSERQRRGKGKRRYSWLLSNCDEEEVLGHEALEE